MAYRTDLSDCRFITDHEGNRLRADVPYTLFMGLVEFKEAALRAQSARIESATPPGAYRGSLSGLPSGTEPEAAETPAPPRVAGGRKMSATRQRAEELFCEGAHQLPHVQQLYESVTPPKPVVLSAVVSPISPVGTSHASPVISSVIASAVSAPLNGVIKSNGKKQVYFPRIFRAAIPAQVKAAIDSGVYFLAAWREHRGYSINDAAELVGLNPTTIKTHEYGLNVPSVKTLTRFAEAYDCSLEQLTPKKNSNVKPPNDEAPPPPPTACAPAETDYPDSVLSHLLDGKTPLTAWRLYRRMTIAQLADAYGTTQQNIHSLERTANYRTKTRERLAVALSCRPVQLLLPEGFMADSARAA